MKKVLFFAMVFIICAGLTCTHNHASAQANQDHTCQGGHNCTDTGGDATVTNTTSVSNTTSTSNSTNVDVPVSTASAPNLTTSNDTCMGSSSVGAQGAGFGLSLGSTWNDDDCVRRKDARFLHNTGRTGVALALMCQSENVRAAIAKAGTPQEKELCGVTEEDVQRSQETNNSLDTNVSYND